MYVQDFKISPFITCTLMYMYMCASTCIIPNLNEIDTLFIYFTDLHHLVHVHVFVIKL